VARAYAWAAALASGALLMGSLAGCSGVVEDPISADLDRAQAGLALDFATLMDSEGFVANPDGGGSRPLDMYSTAWLLTLADSIGIEAQVAPFDDAAVADAAGLATELGVPDAWRAWSWMVLVDHGADTLDDAREALAKGDVYDSQAPVDDRAVALWVASHMESRLEGGSSYPGDLDADVRQAIGSPNLSVTTTWLLWEACGLVNARCDRPSPAWQLPATLDAQAILDWASAAELDAAGLSVAGYHPSPDVAAREFSALSEGSDLIAEQLTRILVLEGASTQTAQEYWERSMDRRDAVTGVFRQYVEMRGTIETTYEARAALGAAFDGFIEDSPTRDSVRDILNTRSRELGMPAVAKAVAIMTPWGEEPPQQYGPLIDAVRAEYDGEEFAGTDGAAAIDATFVLAGLGVDTPTFSVAPVPIETATERYALLELQAAYSGLLANGDQVIEYYAEFVNDLPSRIEQDGSDSPFFVARIGVLDYLDTDLSQAWWTAVEGDVADLKGCEGLPHMIARDSARTNGCDVNLSAAVVNTSVGIRTLGVDDA